MVSQDELMSYQQLLGDSAAIYQPFPSFESWRPPGFDTTAFDRYASALKDARARATAEQLSQAIENATRMAAVDTGAIEGLYSADRGFTYTVAAQAAAWETLVEARGNHVRDAIEDALAGYEYVLDAATRFTEITEVWLRELHSIICASQATYTVYTAIGAQQQVLPKGVYKSHPNSPMLPTGEVHAYAAVADTAPEMERLIGEFRSESFQEAHPVLQAAYAHYAFVCVHPFADGNGRVSRTLASVFLYRDPGVPLVIFADQKAEYFAALRAADGGRPSSFVDFIGVKTLDAIGIIRAGLSSDALPINVSLLAISNFFAAASIDENLRAATVRLRDEVGNELRRQISELNLPSQIRISVNSGEGGSESVEAPAGYQSLGKDSSTWIFVQCEWPAEFIKSMKFRIFPRASDEAPSDFVIKTKIAEPIDVWQREISPILTETLKLKLSSWCRGKIADLLQQIELSLQTGQAGR